MPGRPSLDIGTHGKIRTSEVEPTAWRAYCQYRDLDGRTRQVSASGASRAAAERELKRKLKRRSTTSTADITPETKLKQAAEEWYLTFTTMVDAGRRSPTTAEQYRCFLDRYLLPEMGQVRLREITTGRVDKVLQTVKANAGEPTAKSCRTVLSNVLKYAARHDAVSTNATRMTQELSAKPKDAPRSLTLAEVQGWLFQLAKDETAVRWDLVDLTGFLLGEGCRIGEALALAWDSVDLDAGKVEIDYTLVRVKKRGLIRKRTKSSAGERTLRMPGFVVAILRRRALAQFALKAGCLPAADAEITDVVAQLGVTPVFPDSKGGWRDPSNTRRALRKARHDRVHKDCEECTCEFAWIKSHVFRKTSLTILDDAGLPARLIADQAGHSQVSMTQDVYMGRGSVDSRAALALDQKLGQVFFMDKPCIDLSEVQSHPV